MSRSRRVMAHFDCDQASSDLRADLQGPGRGRARGWLVSAVTVRRWRLLWAGRLSTCTRTTTYRDHRQATDRAGPGSSPRPGEHHLPAALPRHHHRAHPATLTSASRLRSRRRQQPVREDPTREHRTAPRQARTRRAPRTGHREHPATHARQPPPTPAAPRRDQDHPHQRPFPGLTAAARMPTYSRRMPDQLPAKSPFDIDAYVRRSRTGPCFVCAIVEGHPDYVHRRLRGPGWRQRLHRSEILRHVVSSGSPSHPWKD